MKQAQSELEKLFDARAGIIEAGEEPEIMRVCQEHNTTPLIDDRIWWGYINPTGKFTVRPGHRRRLNNYPPQSIYFIEGGGLIKIGIAKYPQKRLKQFQAGSPVLLRLLGCTSGGKQLEQELHSRFAKSRRHNEWFGPTPELLEIIDRLTR